MARVQRSDSCPPAIALPNHVAELEAELARATAALDDPRYLAGRLERLLADKPDLRDLARYIASSLRSAP